MYRVVVLYEQEPDSVAYAEHAELCGRVPNSVFRHGKVTGAPLGEPRYAYLAEFEFPDQQAFKSGVRSDEFLETGRDVQRRGWPMPELLFVELS
jgi:hypothetical protein